MELETKNWSIETIPGILSRVRITNKNFGYQRDILRHLLPDEEELHAMPDMTFDRVVMGAFLGRQQPETIPFMERFSLWMQGAEL